jgi:hypothetical protein
MARTLKEFLLDPRGEKRFCAFCKYFTPGSPGHPPASRMGDCLFPDSLIMVPSSYRAENEGTTADSGAECPFFVAGRSDLPDSWGFLAQESMFSYPDGPAIARASQ